MSKPQPFVGGNWKSNGTKASVEELVGHLNKIDAGKADVIVSPIFLHIPLVQSQLTNKSVKVAAQNLTPKAGAFTGEISAAAIADAGLQWVIIGHSERRQLYGETNGTVAEKTAAAYAAGLSVIACIGETLAEREQKEGGSFQDRVLAPQLEAIMSVTKDLSKLVIAYEPVWAIGTGVVATPEQAEEVHAWIRKWLSERIGEQANTVRIIYGGSVNGGNAAGLYALPNVNGFLVGGASLKPEFATIVAAVNA
eukprot:TRINITY_DN44842_c0_g1_i1.p1 TRINITY_DN44842_c0_g1~~TRINITY_DN44842_c0_g1_i1.p1  ORF type:complete len:252 (-),score=43.41 TRINITY_DN44842_c0_g1_i1:121-876(-)